MNILKTEIPKAETVKFNTSPSAKAKAAETLKCRNADTRKIYSRAALAPVMRIHQMVQGGSFPNCSRTCDE